jgi:ATP-dependent Lon protease
MSEQFVDLSLPEEFNNTVRLFPLPSVVLFPGVVQGLHIFEPRYREMMSHCMETDQLITMALLNPQLSENPNGDPAIQPVVCIGRVLNATELEDGRFNLFLVGAKRATVTSEPETSYPYRIATVDVHEEVLVTGPSLLRDQVLGRFYDLAEVIPGANKVMLDQFESPELPLNRLVDMICYAAGIDPADQQRVLATFDLEARARLLLELLEQRLAIVRQMDDGGPTFPPEFSLN